ncbi:MAG: ABC transporter substrate-binding protein [Candidatus Bathyarchaeota archaeon]
MLRGAILAAEQINAEGGLLGKDFEIVSEDDDSESANLDITIASNALTRLITVDKADFILAGGGFPNIAFQDISAEHKKILLLQSSSQEDLTQRVLDDYGKYKYFFRSGIPNSTSAIEGTVESVLIAREHTGFNKVAVLYHDLPGFDAWFSTVIETLIENDFEVVYEDNIPMDILDFSSYFAHAEAAGAEILFPLILGSAGISFVNE